MIIMMIKDKFWLEKFLWVSLGMLKRWIWVDFGKIMKDLYIYMIV